MHGKITQISNIRKILDFNTGDDCGEGVHSEAGATGEAGLVDAESILHCSFQGASG